MALFRALLPVSLNVEQRRHLGPDPVCVQEIGLYSLPRILFQYQTTRDHLHTGAVAVTPGWNLGAA